MKKKEYYLCGFNKFGRVCEIMSEKKPAEIFNTFEG